jgi:hypothetical protein
MSHVFFSASGRKGTRTGYKRRGHCRHPRWAAPHRSLVRRSDEALAGVDLFAENLAEVAGLGAEDFLCDGRVAQPCKDGRDPAACLPELTRCVAQEGMKCSRFRCTSAETRVSAIREPADPQACRHRAFAVHLRGVRMSIASALLKISQRLLAMDLPGSKQPAESAGVLPMCMCLRQSIQGHHSYAPPLQFAPPSAWVRSPAARS